MTSAEGYYKTGDLGSTGADTLVALEQSVGAIILVRVMEVSEHLFEFAEEQRLRIGWHSAKVGKGRDELAGQTVMVFRINLYRLYHLSYVLTRLSSAARG